MLRPIWAKDSNQEDFSRSQNEFKHSSMRPEKHFHFRLNTDNQEL